MTSFECKCKRRCRCKSVAIITSIIVGIITAILGIISAISVTPIALWFLSGIALVSLAAVLIVSATNHCPKIHDCLCRVRRILLTGIVGTILTATVLSAITYSCIIAAIISGILMLFFSLIITSAACLIKCLLDCNDD